MLEHRVMRDQMLCATTVQKQVILLGNVPRSNKVGEILSSIVFVDSETKGGTTGVVHPTLVTMVTVAIISQIKDLVQTLLRL